MLIACKLKTSPPKTVHVFFKEKVELPQPASKEDVRRLMARWPPLRISSLTFPKPCFLSGNQLREVWFSSGYQNMNRPLIRSKKFSLASQSYVSMTPPKR